MPYRNGLASFFTKKSTSGPMKNTVMIVPTPMTAPIPSMEAPDRKNSPTPEITHTRSVMILMYLNFPLLSAENIIFENGNLST